jgi:hypothetical protein
MSPADERGENFSQHVRAAHVSPSRVLNLAGKPILRFQTGNLLEPQLGPGPSKLMRHDRCSSLISWLAAGISDGRIFHSIRGTNFLKSSPASAFFSGRSRPEADNRAAVFPGPRFSVFHELASDSLPAMTAADDQARNHHESTGLDILRDSAARCLSPKEDVREER